MSDIMPLLFSMGYIEEKQVFGKILLFKPILVIVAIIIEYVLPTTEE